MRTIKNKRQYHPHIHHPSNFLSDTLNRTHWIDDNDRWNAFYCCMIVLGVIVAALLIALIVIVVKNSQPVVQPVPDLGFVGTDLAAWGDNDVDCCISYSATAIAIGLNVGLRGFCNAISPNCNGPNAILAPQQIHNYRALYSGETQLPLLNITGCFWGSTDTVTQYDGNNTIGIPLPWANLLRSSLTVVLTNELNITWPDPYSGEEVTMPGLQSCDDIVSRASNGVANFDTIFSGLTNVNQIEL